MDKYGSSYTNSYFIVSKDSEDRINAWKNQITFGGKIVTNTANDDEYGIVDAFNIDWEHSKIQVAGSYVTSSAHLAYLIDYAASSAANNANAVSNITYIEYDPKGVALP